MTDDYIKSDFLRNDFECAKNFNRLILFVLIDISNNIEDIFGDINAFEFIIFSKPFDLEINREPLWRFKLFLFRSLNIENFIFNRSNDYFIDMRVKIIKEYDFENDERPYYKEQYWNFSSDGLQVISDSEIILKRGNCLKVINIKNGYEVTSEININSNETGWFSYQYIKHIDKIFVIDWSQTKEETNTNSFSLFYDKNGMLSRKINLGLNLNQLRDTDQDRYSIVYNYKMKKTFLCCEVDEEMSSRIKIYTFDENFNCENIKNLDYVRYYIWSSVKILFSNDYLFILNYPNLHVYNFSISHVATIETKYCSPCPDHADFNIFNDPKNSNNIFIGHFNDYIEIIDTNLFLTIAIINIPYTSCLKMVFNENILLTGYWSNDYIMVCKINFNNNIETKPNSDYNCRINPLKTHLYVNPYLLPCGNTICLECVYKNFNIHLNKFKCNFENCQQFHKLQQKLEKNSKLSQAMIENSGLILKNLMEIGNNFIETKGILF